MLPQAATPGGQRLRSQCTGRKSDAEHLRLQERAAVAPKEPERYAALREELRAMKDYEPLLVLDAHLGIDIRGVL